MSDWEKKFDEKFGKFYKTPEKSSFDYLMFCKRFDAIKAFIRTLLEEERREYDADGLKVIKTATSYIKSQCADELEEIKNKYASLQKYGIVGSEIDNLIKKWRGNVRT